MGIRAQDTETLVGVNGLGRKFGCLIDTAAHGITKTKKKRKGKRDKEEAIPIHIPTRTCTVQQSTAERSSLGT